MSGYGFTCALCGEHDEMGGPSLDAVLKRMRRLFWYVKVRGTTERDMSFVLCPYHHARRIARFKEMRQRGREHQRQAAVMGEGRSK